MKWVIFVMAIAICLLMILCYALLVTAYEADERAERMYRKWKEQLDYDMHNNGEDLDSDYNIGINHAMCVIEAMKGKNDEAD
jgi:hypothetical protein